MHNNSPIITLPRQGRVFLGGKGDGGALGLGTPIVFYVLGMGLWGPEGDVCDFCFFGRVRARENKISRVVLWLVWLCIV